MAEVDLSAGTVEYLDTGGEGPVVVLLHGVAMDGSLWRNVVEPLRSDVRCVVPTLPLGGHRRPMRPDADLSVAGVARLVAEFLDRLGLRDVTLVMSDWGGAPALVSEGRDERIGRLVITSCEAFDNFPPGVPGGNLLTSAKLPGGISLAFRLLTFLLDGGAASSQSPDREEDWGHERGRFHARKWLDPERGPRGRCAEADARGRGGCQP
ncbi:alpha/beta fold hydrolase [Streptomyces sp. NBC_00209]|uniref:alpha/beta fold hydrolase n=1 Tax=Streptomyces sp. NBC_00209 TaxID=2975682 RepID=UPI003250F05C